MYMEENHIFAYERIAKDGKHKVLVLSNYQNCDYELPVEGAYSSVLMNNYPELEIRDGKYFLKPYQTVILE